MPVRAVLNMVYVLLTRDMDEKQREEFDTNLHGWGEFNNRANRVLREAIEDEGGER